MNILDTRDLIIEREMAKNKKTESLTNKITI